MPQDPDWFAPDSDLEGVSQGDPRSVWFATLAHLLGGTKRRAARLHERDT